NGAAPHQALDRLRVGGTTLVLAHRLSSVIGCDRVLVMDEGRIVEEGNHETLVARRGAYWRLMAEQLQGGGDGEALAPLLPAAAEDAVLRAADAAEPGIDLEPRDAIIRAEGLTWAGVLRELLAYARPWKGRLTLTSLLGVARVAAFIGVGVFSALA